MTKDRSIWRLIAQLSDALDAHAFQLVDHWDGDLCAIGIATTRDPDRLVYVLTFQQPPGCYAYECEEPRPGEEHATVTERGEGVTFDQLVDVIRRHLSIATAARS